MRILICMQDCPAELIMNVSVYGRALTEVAGGI